MTPGEYGFFVLQCIYLMLPAYFANMAPVMFKRAFPRLAFPMDFGRSMGGKRILGDHKTFRGLLLGTIMGVLVAYLQHLGQGIAFLSELSLLDYSQWFMLGFLLGLGSLVGDMVKSFFKRRVAVKPGRPFVPFDQLDFVLGALLFVWLVAGLTWGIVLTTAAVSVALHIITNHIAFYTGIRKEKW